MATIDEIKKRIAVANGETKRLNNERQVSIGRRDTLTEQLSSMLEKYNQTYGVALTKENIDSELERVTAEKEQEVTKIEQVLTLINSGNYTEAQNIVDGKESTPVQEQQTEQTAPPAQPVEPVQMSLQIDTPPVAQETPVAPPTAPTAPVPPVAPTAPVPPATPVAPTQPTAPVPPMPSSPVATPPVNDTGIDALDGFSAPAGNVTPPPAMPADTPSNPAPPTSFGAILNGTAFNPN